LGIGLNAKIKRIANMIGQAKENSDLSALLTKENCLITTVVITIIRVVITQAKVKCVDCKYKRM